MSPRPRCFAAEFSRSWARGTAEPNTATISFEAIGTCAVRSANVEVKTSQPFVIRNSAFGVSLGPEHADTFRRDLHPDLRADYVLANPPFNDSDWFRKDDDVRWQFGVPPKGNANFAWVQHFIHHLAPHGMAGFVFEKMKRDTAIANFSLN